MNFAGGINCPPYETADGFLQTTEGFSHNTCLFCTYFKDQKFRKSTLAEIEADIREIPRYFGAPKRIFLQGADGFAADYDVLMKRRSCCTNTFPRYRPSAAMQESTTFTTRQRKNCGTWQPGIRQSLYRCGIRR